MLRGKAMGKYRDEEQPVDVDLPVDPYREVIPRLLAQMKQLHPLQPVTFSRAGKGLAA